jgi:hypothetical protein
MAVDEHSVVVFLDRPRDVRLLPLGVHLRRLVEDVAEADHRPASIGLQRFERGEQFAACAERMLVGEDDGRLERVDGRLQQRVADGDDVRAPDGEAASRVLLVRDLAESGQLDHVHARRDAERLDLVCAGREQDGSFGLCHGQGGRDCQVAPRMTEAEAVV